MSDRVKYAERVEAERAARWEELTLLSGDPLLNILSRGKVVSRQGVVEMYAILRKVNERARIDIYELDYWAMILAAIEDRDARALDATASSLHGKIESRRERDARARVLSKFVGILNSIPMHELEEKMPHVASFNI